jgi:hypothetical protein
MEKISVTINGTQKSKNCNTASLTVNHKDYFHQIHIGHKTGTGKHYRDIDEAQVCIYVNGKPVWEGSFEALIPLLTINGFPKTVTGGFGKAFTLHVITKELLYYVNEEEGDDNGNTICMNKKMEILSDNCHASNSLMDISEKLANNKAQEPHQEIEWCSEYFSKYSNETGWDK